jgi:putative MFS transporter
LASHGLTAPLVQSAAVTNAPSPLIAAISARIERLPMTRWQVIVRCLIGVVTFFDAFDQLMISYVLPVISEEWRLAPAGSTWSIVAGSLGMLVGAAALGRLADRFGRVRVIMVALLLYSLTSLLLALSPDYSVFLVLRFIQGIGIGGEVPVAATYISEIAKAHRRGRFVLLYELIFPLGVAIHSIVATLVVPTFGWRWLFVIGAVPLPFVFFIRKLVPESPRWLASKGHHERAIATIEYIERQVSRYAKQPLPPPQPLAVVASTASRKGGSWRELFRPPYLKRTLTIWTMWFTLSFVHFGLVNWQPMIYRRVFGLPLHSALGYSAISTWAALGGALFVALVIDRLGRRWTLGAALTVGGMILATVWLLGARPLGLVVACNACFGFLATVVITGLYLYTPELYPTRIRAMGCSLGGVWGRLGATAGPIAFSSLAFQAGAGIAPAYLMLGTVAVIGGAITLVFCEETSGRVLEEISP